MTRINERTVVQFVEGDGVLDDLVVVVDDSTGTEIILTFLEVDALRKTLAYFVECHLASQTGLKS
jgi:hypothetical protein